MNYNAHTKAPKEHWSKIEENCSIYGIKTLLLFYKTGGRSLVSFCLYFVVCFYFLSSSKARSYSLIYLRKLHHFMGKSSPFNTRPSLYHSFKHFLSFANALVDKCIVWMGYFEAKELFFSGYEIHQEIQTRKKGAFILMSHLGNVEICKAIGALKGVSLTILVHDKQTPEFHRILNEISESNEHLDVVQVTDIDASLAMRLQEKLNQGGYIAIAGDRVPVAENNRCEFVKFLGQEAPFAQGPLMLAALFKCPVLLLFCLKEQQGYHVFFEKFSEGIDVPRKERKARIKKEVERYAKRLEYYTCRYPYQWFNFFHYWNQPSASEHNK